MNLLIIYLIPIVAFRPERNLAREKLSILSSSRFSNLVTDTVGEWERRFPDLYRYDIHPADNPVSLIDSPRDMGTPTTLTNETGPVVLADPNPDIVVDVDRMMSIARQEIKMEEASQETARQEMEMEEASQEIARQIEMEEARQEIGTEGSRDLHEDRVRIIPVQEKVQDQTNC